MSARRYLSKAHPFVASTANNTGEQFQMSQLTLDLPKSNGSGHGRPDEKNLAGDLQRWLSDLDATEQLKKEQLRQIGKLRSEIYSLARVRGFTPVLLRVARQLRRNK